MLDHTYCRKTCWDMNCKHNKKHLKGMMVNGKPVVGAVFWSDFMECSKGVYPSLLWQGE